MTFYTPDMYNPASKYPGADSHDEPMADLPTVGAQPGCETHNSEEMTP